MLRPDVAARRDRPAAARGAARGRPPARPAVDLQRRGGAAIRLRLPHRGDRRGPRALPSASRREPFAPALVREPPHPRRFGADRLGARLARVVLAALLRPSLERARAAELCILVVEPRADLRAEVSPHHPRWGPARDLGRALPRFVLARDR